MCWLAKAYKYESLLYQTCEEEHRQLIIIIILIHAAYIAPFLKLWNALKAEKNQNRNNTTQKLTL